MDPDAADADIGRRCGKVGASGAVCAAAKLRTLPPLPRRRPCAGHSEWPVARRSIVAASSRCRSQEVSNLWASAFTSESTRPASVSPSSPAAAPEAKAASAARSDGDRHARPKGGAALADESEAKTCEGPPAPHLASEARQSSRPARPPNRRAAAPTGPSKASSRQDMRNTSSPPPPTSSSSPEPRNRNRSSADAESSGAPSSSIAGVARSHEARQAASNGGARARVARERTPGRSTAA